MARWQELLPWRQPSFRLIQASWVIAGVALVINALRKAAFRGGAAHLSSFLELLGLSLFVLAYFSLWVLLVVGFLRPTTAFSTRGFRQQRIRNLIGAIVALIVLHVVLAFAVATAGS